MAGHAGINAMPWVLDGKNAWSCVDAFAGRRRVKCQVMAGTESWHVEGCWMVFHEQAWEY
jgi:hypothetical protein